MDKEKEEASLFVPIGGGSYVKAKLESTKTVTVGIGAGVAIERTIKEAKENLEKRIADLEKMRTTLQQQLTQVLEKIQEGRSMFQELSSKLSRVERPRGVRKAKKRT